MFRDYPAAAGVSGFANVKRNVEEKRFDLAVVCLRQFNEGLSIASREVGGVDKRDRALQLKAAPQEISHSGKYRAVDGLIGFIVGKLETKGVARYRVRAQVSEPGGFAGAGKTDCNHDYHVQIA